MTVEIWRGKECLGRVKIEFIDGLVAKLKDKPTFDIQVGDRVIMMPFIGLDRK